MANDNVWIMYTRDTAQTLMTFFFKDIGLNRGTAKWTEKSQDRKSNFHLRLLIFQIMIPGLVRK